MTPRVPSAELQGQAAIQRIEHPAVPVLCYHRVCPKEERGPDSASLCVTPGQFASQLDLLDLLGYTPVSAQDLEGILTGRKNPPKSTRLNSSHLQESSFSFSFF